MARFTIAKALKGNRISPAPERPSTWRTFMKSHWETPAAADFFQIEVWTTTGPRTFFVLFAINIFGASSLRRAVRSYLDHYHRQQNHQGRANKIIDPGAGVGLTVGKIERCNDLGGLLRYDYRAAAQFWAIVLRSTPS